MSMNTGSAAPFPTSEVVATSIYTGPFGRRRVDPGSGKEYILCDAQEAFDAGEWAVINASGQASQLTSTSKGRIGIVVAAASTSDNAIWVQVVGEYSGGYCTSAVTSAGIIIAPATTDVGQVTELTTAGGNVIFGATATSPGVSTVSPTTFGTNTATFYLFNPYVLGVNTDGGLVS